MRIIFGPESKDHISGIHEQQARVAQFRALRSTPCHWQDNQQALLLLCAHGTSALCD